MAPDDIYELAAASDPRLSPDGQTVAFVVARVDRKENEYRSAIYLAPADGSSTPRRLTAGEKQDSAPRWSPDGTELAFISNRAGEKKQLYVLPLSGGEPRRLTDVKESVREPVWSPDGTRLAFSSRVPDSLYDEEDEARRPPHRFKRLWFKLDDEGWTGDRRQQLFVVVADGSSEPVQLTHGDYESSAPAWSPDGSQIAYLYTPGIFDAPRHTQVAVIGADGGEPRILTQSLDRNCAPYPPIREPAWDGKSIVFGVEDRGNTHVYRAAAD